MEINSMRAAIARYTEGYSGAAQVKHWAPCAEQTLDGGFLVPASVVEKFNKFIEGERVMRKQWINSDENTQVNSELVTSWSWDHVEISEELSRAGIETLTLYLDTADGKDHIISDLDELVLWARFTLEDHQAPVPGSFEYYVSNAKRYRDMCEEEVKL
jgi:hypothetical protein